MIYLKKKRIKRILILVYRKRDPVRNSWVFFAFLNIIGYNPRPIHYFLIFLRKAVQEKYPTFNDFKSALGKEEIPSAQNLVDQVQAADTVAEIQEIYTLAIEMESLLKVCVKNATADDYSWFHLALGAYEDAIDLILIRLKTVAEAFLWYDLDQK